MTLLNTNKIHDQLSKTTIYNELNDNELNNLIDNSSIVNFPAESLIVRQNEYGDAMYLILHGEVSIFSYSIDNHVTLLSTLKSGEHFGEHGLLPGANGLHIANAKTLVDSSLLIIPKRIFLNAIEHKTALLRDIKTIGQQQLRYALAQESALFRSVKLDNYNAYHLNEKNFSEGEVIFRENDKGDNFYLILLGKVEVFNYEAGKEKHLNDIGPGGYFGELSLINNEPRSATVRAKTEVLTLVLDSNNFRRLYHDSPQLRSHFQHIEHIYRLPNSGFLSMHPCTFMDMDALSTVYHGLKGLQLTVTKVTNKAIVSIARISTIEYEHVETITYQDNSSGIFRELILHYGVIVGATCYSSWDDLGYALEIALNETPLQKRQIALFKLEGELRLVREEFNLSDATIVCKCTAVTRGQLKKCIANGCNTVNELSEETGASKVCGSCGPLLVDLVGHTDLQLVKLVKSVEVINNIKSFQFEPHNGKLPDSKMGQHIFIEAEIKGHWVRRTYTLTSPTHQSQYYEITVKKENKGLFSTWLHEEATDESVIRASFSSGGFKFNSTEKDTVFFVSGIGITPLINFIRSHDFSTNNKFAFIISSSDRQHTAYVEELETLDINHKNIKIYYQYSKLGNRLNKTDIIKITKQYNDAQFFICGPENYETDVTTLLLKNKINEKNIYTEHFQSTANKANTLPSIKGANFLWLFSLLSIIILGVIIFSEPFPINDTVQGDRSLENLISDKILKQITGFTIIGITVLSLVLSLRKRVNKFKLGRFSYWRLFHLFLGVLIVSGLFIHTGFSFGNNLNNYLVIIFSLVAVLGILSMIFKLIQNKSPSSSLFVLQDKFNWLHIFISTLLPGFVLTHIISGYYF